MINVPPAGTRSRYRLRAGRVGNKPHATQNVLLCTITGAVLQILKTDQIGGYFTAREALHGVQPSPGLTACRRAQSHGP
jgi:hypothetical protein